MTELKVATSHDLEERFILIECRDGAVRKRMAAQIADIPRLQRIEEAAKQLLSLVANKGQPMTHPDNQRLINAGDTISVNEGNLWMLHAALHFTSDAEPK